MSLFITQCPHCHTAFRTSISQLQSADGMVRCGACLRVFAADDNLLPSVDLRTIESPVPDDLQEEDDPDLAEEQAPSDAFDVDDAQLAIEELETDVTESAEEDEIDSIFTLDMADSLPNRLSPQISSSEPFWQLIEEEPVLATEPPSESLAVTEQEAESELDDLADIDTPAADDEPRFTEPQNVDEPVELPQEASAAENTHIRSRITAIDFDDDIFSDNAAQKSYTRFSAEEIEGVSSAEAPLELHWIAGSERRRSGLTLYSLGVLFILGLASQYLWFNKEYLSQNPSFRSGLEAACDLLPCALPPLEDLRSIHSDTLVVRSHSEIANALTVNFQFRNDARFPQAFPDLSLRFTDADNKRVAERRFAPSEYLPEGVADLGVMPPGAPIQVRMDILDPGIKAINYEISFFPSTRR